MEKNTKEIVQILREYQSKLTQRGLSWKTATTIPISFSLFSNYIPSGTYQAELLLKIWKDIKLKRGLFSKVLFCYFVDLNNEQNIFCLTAFDKFPNKKELRYTAQDREIDFSNEPLGSQFVIEVADNPRSPSMSKWISAKRLE